jgi:trk system potassium uptake protein TrkH
MDLRPILYIVGIFTCVLAITMAIPIAIDAYDANKDWQVFAYSMCFTAFCGVTLILANKQDKIKISGHQAFFLTALSWLSLCFFSSLPFFFAHEKISFTDSMFEAVSGLTTTGSTIMSGLDTMPRGLLIWRAILQWLGGVGIIVMAISVLPFLKVGGMQLFRLESSEKEKTLPRVRQLAGYIIWIYIILTALCAAAYYYVGMPSFDAMAHAMTTISTGGYSTRDQSFAGYENMGPEIVAIIFMILGCLPFVLYIKCLSGDFQSLCKDRQARTFLKTIIVCCAIILIYLLSHYSSFSLRLLIESCFTTISLITGTGYANANYTLWGGFAVGFLMFVSCIGGCAGSTTCGIKIFRFQILFAVAKNQILMLIHPNGVFPLDYNGQPLSIRVAGSVMAYFFIFIITTVVVSLILLACDLDLITSLSGAIASVANVGPGLGDIIGPTGNFQPLPDTAKWTMIVAMVLGRLEFFTLLVFLFPQFWKRN